MLPPRPLLALLALLTLTATAHAQTTPTPAAPPEPPVAWTVALAEADTLWLIAPDRAAALPLPAEAAAANAEIAAYHVGSGVLIFVTPTDNAMTLWVANMRTGACCTEVPNPLGAPPQTIAVGPFNAEGDRILATYERADLPSTSALVSIDAATATIEATLDASAQFGGNQTARVGTWGPDGVLLYTTCLACEQPARSGFYALWNPDDGTLAENVSFFHILSDRLPATNETLYADYDDQYPAAPVTGSTPAPNVLKYIHSGTVGLPEVVFAVPAALPLPAPRWVADGLAYLLPYTDRDSLLVRRDGSMLLVPTPAGTTFLAGTPLGWLAVAPASDDRLHLFHTFVGNNADNELIVLDLGPMRAMPRVLARASMGGGVPEGMLLTAVAEASPE